MRWPCHPCTDGGFVEPSVFFLVGQFWQPFRRVGCTGAGFVLRTAQFIHVAPGLERFHDGHKRFSKRGERIVHPWGNRAVHRAAHKSVVFQFAQLAHQHTFADFRQGAAQLAKANDLLQRQKIDDQQLPLAANELQGQLKVAAVIAHHGRALGRVVHLGGLRFLCYTFC